MSSIKYLAIQYHTHNKNAIEKLSIIKNPQENMETLKIWPWATVFAGKTLSIIQWGLTAV